MGKAWRKRSHAREARERHTPVGPQSRSLFSASFQTFCLTARASLNTQKYGLFCSLGAPWPHIFLQLTQWGSPLEMKNLLQLVEVPPLVAGTGEYLLLITPLQQEFYISLCRSTTVDDLTIVLGHLFPFNKNVGLKFRKFHMPNRTVYSGCKHSTQLKPLCIWSLYLLSGYRRAILETIIM